MRAAPPCPPTLPHILTLCPSRLHNESLDPHSESGLASATSSIRDWYSTPLDTDVVTIFQHGPAAARSSAGGGRHGSFDTPQPPMQPPGRSGDHAPTDRYPCRNTRLQSGLSSSQFSDSLLHTNSNTPIHTPLPRSSMLSAAILQGPSMLKTVRNPKTRCFQSRVAGHSVR